MINRTINAPITVYTINLQISIAADIIASPYPLASHAVKVKQQSAISKTDKIILIVLFFIFPSKYLIF